MKIHCRKCDYCLDGLDSRRCPECGRPFDPARRATIRPHSEIVLRNNVRRIGIVGPFLLVYGLIYGSRALFGGPPTEAGRLLQTLVVVVLLAGLFITFLWVVSLRRS